MKVWEYKTVSWIGKEDKLNELGKQGWELVCCDVGTNGWTDFLIFKRPIEEEIDVTE